MVSGPITFRLTGNEKSPDNTTSSTIDPRYSSPFPSSIKMPVPVSADGGPSPPSEHEHAPRGYRPPPGAYGGHYPYAYPPGPYGPPPPGYGPPPPGYPHHPPPTSYSPPGYPGHPGRAMYGYPMYEGHPGSYHMQHPRDRSKSPSFSRGRGSHGSRPSSQQRHSPVPRPESAKTSPEQPASLMRERETPDNRNVKIIDEMETERLRQAAEQEVSPEQVAPIKTSFHFFVEDVRESLKRAAEEEVRKTSPSRNLDPYLINSNLNCRLMKAWEELTADERNDYMTREEADRRRFMEEEEIASRHCATLTARSKSPKTPERRNGTPNTSPTSFDQHHVPPPSPIARLSVEQDSSNDGDEKKTDDHSARMESRSYIKQEEMRVVAETGDGNNKRSSPKTEAEEEGASPPKRNRVDNEGGTEGVSA